MVLGSIFCIKIVLCKNCFSLITIYFNTALNEMYTKNIAYKVKKVADPRFRG